MYEIIMNKKIYALSFSLILLMGLVMATFGIPHIFRGTILSPSSHPGGEIPEGTQITASIGGTSVGIVGYVEEDNKYGMQEGMIQVKPQGITGTIRFFIGGIPAEEEQEYVSGQINDGENEEGFNLTLESWTDDWASCGDGVRDEGEQCDGNDIGVIFGEIAATCDNLWYNIEDKTGYTGTVLCTEECLWDYHSNCSAPVQTTTTTTNNNNNGGGGSSSSSSSSSTSSSVYTPLSTTGSASGSEVEESNLSTEISLNESGEETESRNLLTGAVTGITDFAKRNWISVSFILGVLVVGTSIIVFRRRKR